MDANEQKARELLAAEYERDGLGNIALDLLHGVEISGDDERAIAAICKALAQQVPADGEWVLVPRAFIAELDDQLIDLSNERMAKGRAYSDRERVYDADILQRLRAIAATPQAPQPVVGATIGQQAVDDVRKLPAKWRGEADSFGNTCSNEDRGYSNAQFHLADELDAAIAAHGKGG